MSDDLRQIPTSPRGRVTIVLCWAIIWGFIGLTLWADHLPQVRARRARQTEEDTHPAAPSTLMARYAIGFRSTLEQSASDPQVQKSVIQSLQKTHTRSNDIDAAIMSGELLGAEAAMEELSKIEQNPSTRPTTAAAATQPDIADDVALLRTIYTQGPAALKPIERQRLINRYDYFGQVAVTYKLPSSDPLRQEVIAKGEKTFATLLTMMVFVIGLACAGLVLLILTIVFLALGKVRPLYVPNPLAGPGYLESFTGYFLGMVGLSVLLIALKAQGLSWNWLALLLLPMCLLWPVLRGEGWDEVKRSIGWNTGRGFWIEAPLGLLGYITGMPIIAVGIMVSYALSTVFGADTSHPIGREIGTPLSNLQVFAIARIMAPLIEETLFRGMLFHHLRRRWGWAVSALFSGFIFAIIHPQGWTAAPALGSIGFVLASIREWRGTLAASMTAHAANNFAVILLLVLGTT